MTTRPVCCALASFAIALPLAAQTAASCADCGEERWDIKTLSDAAAKKVQFTPKATTVKALYNLPAPTAGAVRNTSEMQAYTVHAKLIGYKIEFEAHAKPGQKAGDHDFHIVIQDPNGPETIIVEIPDPACSGVCTSLKKDAIAKARSNFLANVEEPPKSEFFSLQQPVDVVVTGVSFFDFAHGQTGLAKNCIELHPVIDFQFPSGKVPKTANPANEPKGQPQSFYHCLKPGAISKKGSD